MKLFRISLLVVATVLGGCSWLKSDHPDYIDDRERTAEQIYEQAQLAAKRGEFDDAIDRYELLQARFPFHQLSQQAQLDLIYLYYRAERMEEVVAAADRFVRLNPTHPRVDYAYYMRGSANLERGQDFLGKIFNTDRALRDPVPLRQAFTDFRRLVVDYPDSAYVDDATYQLRVIKNQLARHELGIAEFYLQQGAYVAAANRAKTIVEDYQGTPAVQAALEVLLRSYDHLDLPQLRQDVLRIIRLNFPDHPLARQAG